VSDGGADFLPIVLGTSLNAYGIARSFHEAYGVRTLALGRARPYETADSAILDVRAFPDFDDPARLLAVLAQVADEFRGRRLLLIPTIEYYTRVLMEYREQLAGDFVIPLVPLSLGERLMDKTAFYAVCAELGVPYPRTVVMTRSSAADIALPFDYPIILKPADTELYPGLKFAGRKKVYLISDAAELWSTAQRIYDAGYVGDLILQEYLSGDESVMQVVNTYSDRHGRMRMLCAAQVVLGVWNPDLVGNYNAVVTMHDDALTQSIRTLLDSVGYVGAANFDVMVDARTGESKLLEVNLRQGAASYCVDGAGVSFARYYVEDLILGREVPDTVVTAERLWANVPYPLIRLLAPPAMWALARRARRSGVSHTLVYPADRSVRRRIDVARVDVLQALSYWRFRGSRPARR
jgi:D-aspartate ligase